MNAYQNLRLYEWIDIGKQIGKIREARTVVLAYCMDEREALPWIADIVRGADHRGSRPGFHGARDPVYDVTGVLSGDKADMIKIGRKFTLGV